MSASVTDVAVDAVLPLEHPVRTVNDYKGFTLPSDFECEPTAVIVFDTQHRTASVSYVDAGRFLFASHHHPCDINECADIATRVSKRRRVAMFVEYHMGCEESKMEIFLQRKGAECVAVRRALAWRRLGCDVIASVATHFQNGNVLADGFYTTRELKRVVLTETGVWNASPQLCAVIRALALTLHFLRTRGDYCVQPCSIFLK